MKIYIFSRLGFLEKVILMKLNGIERRVVHIMDHPEITIKQYMTANKIMQMYHEIQEINQDKN